MRGIQYVYTDHVLLTVLLMPMGQSTNNSKVNYTLLKYYVQSHIKVHSQKVQLSELLLICLSVSLKLNFQKGQVTLKMEKVISPHKIRTAACVVKLILSFKNYSEKKRVKSSVKAKRVCICVQISYLQKLYHAGDKCEL